MFRKPFHVKSSVRMRSSDQRKLKARVEAMFTPGGQEKDAQDAEASLAALWDEITAVKIMAHGQIPLVLYANQANQPLLFEGSDGKLIPTVYMLWACPKLLPYMTTWRPVFDRLAGGADLMLPGVVVRKKPSPTTSDAEHRELILQQLGPVSVGQTRAVNVLGNGAAVAVGTTLVDEQHIRQSGMAGRGVQVLHTFGDYLWQYGSKQPIPSLPDAFLISTDEAAAFDASDEEEEKEEEGGVDSAGAVGAATDSQEAAGASSSASSTTNATDESSAGAQQDDATALDVDHDKLLEACLLHALKALVKDKDLPMLISTLYSNYVLACKPPDADIDVKKSKYKKVSKFFKEMEKKGLLKMKETSKGVESLISVNRGHDELMSFVVPEYKPRKAAGAESDEVSAAATKAAVADLYSPPKGLLPFFEEYHEERASAADQSGGSSSSAARVFETHGKDILYSPADLKDVIQRYVARHNLVVEANRRLVKVDMLISDCLLKREERSMEQISREDLGKRFVDAMKPYHQLTLPGRDSVIRKGAIKPIHVQVELRVGRKTATIISNLDEYAIDEETLAKEMAKIAAASATVVKEPGGNSVLVQGHALKETCEHLMSVYAIPKKCIETLDKTQKKK